MLPRAKFFKKNINTKFSNLLLLVYFLAKLVLPIPFVFKVSKPHLPWQINRICWDPGSYFGVNRVLSPYLGYMYLSIVKLQGGKVVFPWACQEFFVPVSCKPFRRQRSSPTELCEVCSSRPEPGTETFWFVQVYLVIELYCMPHVFQQS